MSILLLVVLVKDVLSGQIEFLADRPLTWDWHGTLPIELAQKPSAEQEHLFGLMRQGEYYRASVAASGHLKKNPDDFVDTWILVECARKRGTAEDLVRDANALVKAHRTEATLTLELRAENMFLTWKLGHVSHKEPIGSWFEEGLKRVKSIQSSLRPFVDSLPTLTACMSSYEKDIVLDREAADRLRKANPEKIEYSILYVRSLLQGNTTMRISTIGTKDAPPKPLPRDEVRVMQISPPMRLVSALQELDRLEKKFGTHPLIDYYRAAANASASLFADPARAIVPDELKNMNWRTLEKLSFDSTKAFLTHCEDYPRLAKQAQLYLADHHLYDFFPHPDD